MAIGFGTEGLGVQYVGERLRKTFQNAIPNNNMTLPQHFQFVCLNVGNKTAKLVLNLLLAAHLKASDNEQLEAVALTQWQTFTTSTASHL